MYDIDTMKTTDAITATFGFVGFYSKTTEAGNFILILESRLNETRTTVASA